MPKGVTSWLTPYFEVWKKHMGGDLHGGKAAKFLKPIEAELGPEETLARWMVYCAFANPQFATPARFAEIHGTFAKPQVKQAPDDKPRPLTMGRVV